MGSKAGESLGSFLGGMEEKKVARDKLNTARALAEYDPALKWTGDASIKIQTEVSDNRTTSKATLEKNNTPMRFNTGNASEARRMGGW